MRYWLIGCGSLLLIAVVLGYFGYRYVRDAAAELKDDVETVTAEYRQLERELPFERPPQGAVMSEDYGAFIACRKKMLGDAGTLLGEIEDEETSWRRKISLAFAFIPEVGRAHAAALRETGLSPAEYEWYVDLTLTALKYAEAPDAPPALRDLRQELDAILSDGRPDVRTREGPFEVAVEDPDERGLKSMLPRVDPVFLDLPPETIAAVIEHAAGLRETAKLFVFDAGFVQATALIRDAEKGR